MPHAAFVVTLELDSVDSQTIESARMQIEEDLSDNGFLVIKVDPWDRASQLDSAMTDSSLLSGDPFKQTGAISADGY